jgi:hypothetical protein
MSEWVAGAERIRVLSGYPDDAEKVDGAAETVY